jgi:GT2 family glycosyltransferase
MQPVFTALLTGVAAFLFAVGAAGLFAVVRGYLHLRRLGRSQVSGDQTPLLKSPLVPSLSLLTVVRDSSPASRQFVRRLLEVHYGKFETVLVLDGLGEADVEVWKNEYRLEARARVPQSALPAARVECIYEPRDQGRLVVVSKERGGEDDSLNAAVNVARAPLIGIVEPHAVFQPDAFLQLVRPVMEDPERTVAVCGTAPEPHHDRFSARIGALESLRAWLGRCGSLADRNQLGPVPGCCMLISRETLLQAGGFQAGYLELFLRLHAHARAAGQPYRIALTPEPVSHPGPTRTLRELHALARADQAQIAGALRRHGFHAPGLLPLFAVRVLRPLAETLAYALTAIGLGLGWMPFDLVALVLLSTAGMGILQSMTAVLLLELAASEGSDPGQLARLFFAAIPENLGYRQLRNFWLIAGLFGTDPRGLRPAPATP